MSELSEELSRLDERITELEELKNEILHLPVDFTYWSKASYRSLDEAVALLLSRKPEILNSDIIEEDDPNPELNISFRLISDYRNLRDLVLRACEMKEIGVRNSPVVFLEWAESRDIEIPEALRQEVSIRKSSFISSEAKTEIERVLKIKNEEIASLQKRIEELESSAWEGFNESLDTYSKELDIAVKAHKVISKNWKKRSSIKKQIYVWLQENHPNLSNEEKERISKICNWQKSGGAPCTP